MRFSGADRSVVDGPFAETKELVAGFWLWEVADMDEAVAWVKRCPNPMPGPSEIEIRPIISMEDFAEAFGEPADADDGEGWGELVGSGDDTTPHGHGEGEEDKRNRSRREVNGAFAGYNPADEEIESVTILFEE